MRLFLFVLNRCIGSCTQVVLETVVNETDYINVHKKKIEDTLNWHALRLWIPLSEHGLTLFESSIEDALAIENAAECVFSGPDKRRRLNPDSHVPAPPATRKYLEPVKTTHVLAQLLRLYCTGQGHGDIGDGTTTPVIALNHRRFFTSHGLVDSIQNHGIYKLQGRPENYFQSGVGAAVFSPRDELRPLMRSFRCGGREDAFLRSAGTEIFDYLLPHLGPSRTEITTKIESVLSSAGRYHELRTLTLEQLKEMAVTSGIDITRDPHAYAPIVVSAEDMVGSELHASVFERLLTSTYHIMSSLGSKNRLSIGHHAMTGDWAATEKVINRMVRDLDVLLSTTEVAGVPPVYNRLWKEAASLGRIMCRPAREKSKPVEQLARRIYTARFKETNGFTPLSCAINRLMMGSNNCLRLMSIQSVAFVPFYIASFGVTTYGRKQSPLFIMTGEPGVGKSKIMKELEESVAQSIVWRRDSSSAQADIGNGSKADLQLLFVDEYKGCMMNGTSDSSTKNEQTRICDGYISHDRLEKDPATGGWVTQTSIGLCRRTEITSTNHPGDIPPPILDRSCLIPITLTLIPGERSRTANMGIATANNPIAELEMKAWKLYLRYMSALQVRVSALDAVGGIPPIGEHCFELFWLVYEHMMGKDSMSSRRVNDLKEMAVNISTMNAINTWHVGGLGDHFKHNRSIECLWYAYSR